MKKLKNWVLNAPDEIEEDRDPHTKSHQKKNNEFK